MEEDYGTGDPYPYRSEFVGIPENMPRNNRYAVNERCYNKNSDLRLNPNEKIQRLAPMQTDSVEERYDQYNKNGVCERSPSPTVVNNYYGDSDFCSLFHKKGGSGSGISDFCSPCPKKSDATSFYQPMNMTSMNMTPVEGNGNKQVPTIINKEGFGGAISLDSTQLMMLFFFIFIIFMMIKMNKKIEKLESKIYPREIVVN